jgi:hypothetical protein
VRVFFIIFWVILVIGLVIHAFVDRHPNKRTAPRLIELALLWVLVFGGIWGLFGVWAHVGPDSGQTAEQIGYTQSMFQWEVGFADAALAVLGIGCLWWRDRWLTATVVAWAVSLGGDAVGHIMELSNGNDAPDNVWALPGDLLQVVLPIVLLIAYRRGLGRLPALPKHGVVGSPT